LTKIIHYIRKLDQSMQINCWCKHRALLRHQYQHITQVTGNNRKRPLIYGAPESQILHSGTSKPSSASWQWASSAEHNNYTVAEKKSSQNVLVISSKNLGWFRWNLVHSVLNKFATNWYKRIPSQPNNVSTLPCETQKSYFCGKFQRLKIIVNKFSLIYIDNC